MERGSEVKWNAINNTLNWERSGEWCPRSYWVTPARHLVRAQTKRLIISFGNTGLWKMNQKKYPVQINVTHANFPQWYHTWLYVLQTGQNGWHISLNEWKAWCVFGAMTPTTAIVEGRYRCQMCHGRTSIMNIFLIGSQYKVAYLIFSIPQYIKKTFLTLSVLNYFQKLFEVYISYSSKR